MTLNKFHLGSNNEIDVWLMHIFLFPSFIIVFISETTSWMIRDVTLP